MSDFYAYLTGWIYSLHPVFQNTTIQILMLLAGLVLTCGICFTGYRHFFCFISLIGFLVGFYLGFYACAFLSPVFWIRLTAGAALGLVFVLLSQKVSSLGIFLAIALPSVIVAYSVLAIVLPGESGSVYALGGLIIGFLLGILAVFVRYPIIVVATGFYGAFLFSRTFLRLIQYEHPFVFYGMVFVLTVSGICYQFTHSRR